MVPHPFQCDICVHIVHQLGDHDGDLGDHDGDLGSPSLLNLER
jgi:hypothetical protein